MVWPPTANRNNAPVLPVPHGKLDKQAIDNRVGGRPLACRVPVRRSARFPGLKPILFPLVDCQLMPDCGLCSCHLVGTTDRASLLPCVEPKTSGWRDLKPRFADALPLAAIDRNHIPWQTRTARRSHKTPAASLRTSLISSGVRLSRFVRRLQEIEHEVSAVGARMGHGDSLGQPGPHTF